jgi:hypothetical protein
MDLLGSVPRSGSLLRLTIWAMAAAGVAAVAALEVIGRRKDQVRTFEVVVFGFERGLRFDGGRFLIHAAILSHTARFLVSCGALRSAPESNR